MKHERFNYATLDSAIEKIAEMGLELPLRADTDILRSPVRVYGTTLCNRIAVQPMEGNDGNSEGTPGALTERRYRRFSGSGASLIWFEAVAVSPDGRANPRQLMLTEKNLDAYRRLIGKIKETSYAKNGFAPYLVMQATHSGRYSKPSGRPEPLIIYQNPIFDQRFPADESRVLPDSYLDALPDQYAVSARLAEKAGFDAIDVKCCHRYLLSESLSAYGRPGKYGGDFGNRTRLVRAVAAAVKSETANLDIGMRLNIYDGFPRPYGWGVAGDGGCTPDMAEPAALIEGLLGDYGVTLFNLTVGNPYYNPHVNRPYDSGAYPPPEHPFEGLNRMYLCLKELRGRVSSGIFISSLHSYLRRFSGNMAAGFLESGCSDLAGFGRLALADPLFATEILTGGGPDPARCCVTCGKCAELLRGGSFTGCVVRDPETYLPVYRREIGSGPA